MIEDRDQKTCLKDRQQRQYPFIFWDVAEVKGFKLENLPILKKPAPVEWVLYGRPVVVDLSDLGAVAGFKQATAEVVDSFDDTTTEVGFAIIAVDGSKITIQSYNR